MLNAKIAIVLTLLAALVSNEQAQARRHKSTRAHLKTDDTEITAPADTLRAPSLRLSGYEKVQSATKETFFVTNDTDHHITALCVTVVYVDTSGRELHRRTEQIATDLPAGATRQLQIKSWDTQKVWHYIHTQGRHNAYSTPYDIRIVTEYALARDEKFQAPPSKQN